MMRPAVLMVVVCCTFATAAPVGAQGRVPAGLPAPAGLASEAKTVWETELAFAKTMADRDHGAFMTFLAEDAVFVGRTALRGRSQVAEGWRRYFDGAQAPFSWFPDQVEVTASGTLALSKGPVYDPAGKRTGTFISTWRKDADGKWRIVLDTGT